MERSLGSVINSIKETPFNLINLLKAIKNSFLFFTFTALDEIIHTEFIELENHHRANDEWYESYCAKLTLSNLQEEFPFEAVGLNEREFFSLSLATCLTNLFQHQIHHRGQIHHMISHAGKEPPQVDVVKFARGDVDKWTI